MELVSIIIPVYNTEKKLDDCLKSVCSQTYREIEIILVDDGSSDRSGEICDIWSEHDSRIRVFHQENSGPSVARNVGLRAACGNYIYFMDSDDYAEPELVEKAVKEINGFDMVVFNYRYVDENGNIIDRSHLTPCVFDLVDDKKQFEYLMHELFGRHSFWSLWSRLFRKSVIDKYELSFDENNTGFAEDLYFTFLYLIHSSSIHHIEDECYEYLVHSDSIMGVQSKKYNLGRMTKVVKAIESHLNTQGGYEIIKSNYSVIFYACLKDLLTNIRNRNPEYTIKVIREIIISDVQDLPYFLEQSKSLLNHKKELQVRYGRIGSKEIISEFHYYIDGKAFAYIVRQLIIYMMILCRSWIG